jgi:hypothetical protein
MVQSQSVVVSDQDMFMTCAECAVRPHSACHVNTPEHSKEVGLRTGGGAVGAEIGQRVLRAGVSI